MRIGPAAVQALAEAIAIFDIAERREVYRSGAFPRSEAVKDLDRRYRWDLFWLVQGTSILLAHTEGDLLDSHIDTALRQIVPPL